MKGRYLGAVIFIRHLLLLPATGEPSINITVDSSQLVIGEGQRGEITCYAVGDPAVLGYTWYYNGKEVDPSDDR